MTDDDNTPWTDDRARQSSLLEDDDALRTLEREGAEVSGSGEFMDDRDAPGGMDTGEQAGLFDERRELEDQQALGGGTATETQAGLLDETIEEWEEASPTIDEERRTTNPDPAEIAEFAAPGERDSDEEPLEPEVLPKRLGGDFWFDEMKRDAEGRPRHAVYRRSPQEAVALEASDDQFAVFQEETKGLRRPVDTFDEFDDALDRAEMLAETNDPAGADISDDAGQESLELDARAAEAGMMTARLAERRVDDLDRDTLKSVREELAEVRDEGGTVELAEEELAEFSDAIAEFGAESSPAQRPEGFDVLEERVFEADADAGFESDRDREIWEETVDRMAEEGELDREQNTYDVEPETVEIEFGSRAAANAAREDLPAEALTDEYDRRHKTIEVRADLVDERTLDRVTGMAADSKAHEEQKAGQVALTREEKNRLDFTETTVVEARAAKGIFLAEGVDDWLAYYDPELTVDEQRDVAESAAQQGGGKRMDAGESAVEKAARARRRSATELEEHAITGAKAGEEEAIETLVELGWSPSEARSLAEAAGDDRERAAILDVAIARAIANGRFTKKPPARAPSAPVEYRSPTTGRFVGDAIDPNPGIGRDPADGQFVKKPGL